MEYHYTLLPEAAQAVLTTRYGAAPAANDHEIMKSTDHETPKVQRGAANWAWYDALPAAQKDRAVQRLEALTRVEHLSRRVGRAAAIRAVAAEQKVAVATVHLWICLVRGVNRADWLPALAPQKRGGGGRAVEVCEAVWEAFRAEYLRPSRPSFNSCYRRVEEIARAKGWDMPKARTLRRRVDAIPEAVLTMARQGREATKRLFPAQERDRSCFHAMEAVNADGHKWDVFVRWEDGTIGRPMMIAFQDLYSNMFLAWRFGRSESKDLVRLCFGDMIETHGVPDQCWLDNGRAFASKWLTGGMPNRFRFKVKAEEPLGIFTQLGVQVRWTTPYAGQSKPIERGFGDFARDIAKHPAFEGAYTGNRPDAKPENYGTAAVPIATFIEIVSAEIHKHNARPGRQTKVCGGRLSFREAFEESYARSMIRQAGPEQRRLCMLAAEGVRVRREDGSVHLLNNRYWHQALLEHRGKPVTVRFDPQNVHDDLAVYAHDGSLICIAELTTAAGFGDTDAARTHAAARNTFLRATRELVQAEKTMSLAQLVALQPKTEPEPQKPAPARVVRMITGSSVALKSKAQIEDENDSYDEAFARGLRLVTPIRRAIDNGD